MAISFLRIKEKGRLSGEVERGFEGLSAKTAAY